jgi:hypothetical protein
MTATTAPEAVRPADLTPGAWVVIEGFGLLQVEGPWEHEGKPGIRFSNQSTGVGAVQEALAWVVSCRKVRSLVVGKHAETSAAMRR